MKQTFVQNFRSHDVDKPITRRSVANALRRMAALLDLPEQPDTDSFYQLEDPLHNFEIEGFGAYDNGRIILITNLGT
jgi:hypothetical protein